MIAARLGRYAGGSAACGPVAQERPQADTFPEALDQVVAQEVRGDVAAVADEVVGEEVGLLRGEFEGGTQCEAEVREVHLAAVGEQVEEVRVEVDESA
jgi:hypothetical protein